MTTAIKINVNDGVTRNVMAGAETTISFDFPIFDADHVQVFETDTAGVITELTKDTDFSVPTGSVNQQSGGTLNLLAGPYPSGATAGHVFTVRQNVPYARTTDFNQSGDFFADTLNKELDLIAQQFQQVTRDLSRSILSPVDTAIPVFSVSGPEAGKLLSWASDSTGVIANTSFADISSELDTVFTNLTADEFLQWDGTNWVNAALDANLIALSDLSTVDTLVALEGLSTGANKIPYSTGTDTFSQLDFLDQDDMSSNSATALASQQSIKAYVDGKSDWTYGSQATTSGSTVNVTNIPTGVGEIEIFFNAVSTNGTVIPVIQIGDSGGLETSGYLGGATEGGSIGGNSNGFKIDFARGATELYSGMARLTRVTADGTIWAVMGAAYSGGTATGGNFAGLKTLSAELDRFSLVTTDTLDSGTLYWRYR